MKININRNLENKVKGALTNFSIMDYVGAASMLMMDIDEDSDKLLIADLIFSKWKELKSIKAKKSIGKLFIEVSEFNKDFEKSKKEKPVGDTNG